MKIAIISDIHGNLSAIQKINQQIKKDIKGIVLLGDLIDYGPRSNEVIDFIIKEWKDLIRVNIWGNHEFAIMNDDYSNFSSERGMTCAKFTKKNLHQSSISFIRTMNTEGYKEFMLDSKKCLAIHGSIESSYWKSLTYENTDEKYKEYDYVFSGHSHIPHYIQKFYSGTDEKYRYKKRTIFINPGSLGQPRNHNPKAQYVILDIEKEQVEFMGVDYDIETEQKLYADEIDSFYKERLKEGV